MDSTENPGDLAPTAEELARSKRTYRWFDLVVAVFFLFLGLVALEQVWSELPIMRMGQVGPGMLPFVVGCILVTMSLVLVWQNLRGTIVVPQLVMPTLGEGGRVAAVVVMLALTIALTSILGSLATLALFILLELKLVEGRSWLVAVATAVLIPLFIFASFEALLGVALPAGILGLR